MILFVYKIRNRKKLLKFENWIESDILYIENLRFCDGILDERYVFDKVKTKTNILSEILMLKKALRQYSIHIGNHEPVQELDIPVFNSYVKEIDPYEKCKSKFFYSQVIKHKICISPVQKVLTEKFD